MHSSNQPKSNPQILCLQVTLASAERTKRRSPARLANGHIWTFLADLKTLSLEADKLPQTCKIQQVSESNNVKDDHQRTPLDLRYIRRFQSPEPRSINATHATHATHTTHATEHNPCFAPPCQGGTWEHWCLSCPAPGRS